MQKRLFIVSNRLPISIETTDGQIAVRPSSGGLVSAMNAYLNGSGKNEYGKTVWAGVADCNEKTWNDAMRTQPQSAYGYLPVFPVKKTYEGYYNGFANSILWPVFHYFPTYAEYNGNYYDSYMAMNQKFAEVLSMELKKDDVVWIHDYHLLPLAGMLRERYPSLTIGFFLHIPFPSYELFRIMPKDWQHSLLVGMLGADLIGFHTIDYASHFLSCIQMVLRLENDGQYITWQNRKIKADVFPISIDYKLFNQSYDKPEVQALRKQYLEIKGERKMIFSVDRLDYSKGLSNRLKGYEYFLHQYPEYHNKVQFVLTIVPSRDNISKYAERKKMIDEYIGSLNSKLGNIGWQPIIYQYNHLSFDELVGLYTACDLALITPLRDGMNLVSKEFVASRKDRKGVLVLSEMAGASRELTEALSINPNDEKEIAAMIRQGLEMPADEQARRMSAMQQRIRRYDVEAWGADFFKQLRVVKTLQQEFEVKFLDNVSRAQLLETYARASRRLLLFDYDGTLTPFAPLPSMAVPSKALLDTLQKLCTDPKNDVYIISGRNCETLEKWLGHLPVGLIAEHGAMIRYCHHEEWKKEVNPNVQWMQQIEQVMEEYVSRCPNSFIERKDYSIAWHYRNADPKQSALRARELYTQLQDYTSTFPVNVLNGNKVIEVRNNGVNKGTATEKVLGTEAFDFALAIGDDRTDEDMFRQLVAVPHATTIKVGSDASYAHYNLHTPYMVQSLLETLAVYIYQYQ